MRVIQDSEDEEDFELEEVGAVPEDGDASRADPPPQLEQHSTGSTDSLKRRIEDGHRSHFQSPSGASSDNHHVPHSSVSLPEHANKRRKTSSDASAAESPRLNSFENRGPVTCGKSRAILANPTLEEQPNDASTVPTEPLPEKPWELQGTVQEQWQHHEPGMFVDPSSTVPYATATQQRLLEEVMAPAFLGIEPDPDAPRYEPAKSSIPWSEYLKSSARDISDQARSISQSESPSVQQEGSTSQENFSGGVALEPSLVVTSVSQWSQRSRRESASQQKGSPLRNEVHQGAVNPIRATAPLTHPVEELSAEIGFRGSATPSSKNRTSLDSPPTLAEPRKSPRQRQKSQEDTSTKAQHKAHYIPNSKDDLMSIDLLKEQYNPRPSRSRSLKLAPNEHVDYSVRPEKAARKPRRARTSGVENGSANTTPEKIRSICDMGFTPSTTQKALKQNNGDVISTVDWLIANGATDEDELAPAKTSMSTKKKKKKQKATEEYETPFHANEPLQQEVIDVNKREGRMSFNTTALIENTPVIDDDIGEANVLAAPTLPNPSKSPRVSVVIPKKGQASPSKDDNSHRPSAISPTEHNATEASRSQVKRRKISVNQPETVLEKIMPVETYPTEPLKEKKKRGRPKKEAKSSEILLETQPDAIPIDSRTANAAPQEIQANALADMETDGIVAKTQMVKAGDSGPIPPVTNQDAPATDETCKEGSETPQKPSKSDKFAQASSSNQSKLKTPYRVGLSKRARIAPLLRSVKK